MGSLLKISRSLWDLLRVNWQAALQFAMQRIYLIRQEPFNQYGWVGSKWRTLPIWMLTVMQYPGLSAYPKWDFKNCRAWGSWRMAMGEREKAALVCCCLFWHSLWTAAHVFREELFVNTPVYLSLARAAGRKFYLNGICVGKSLENTWSYLEASISNTTSGWLEDTSLSRVKASECACVLVCVWRMSGCTCSDIFFCVFELRRVLLSYTKASTHPGNA